MVLVDTSVWIRGLRGEGNYQAELDRLLADDEVAGHELVFGELLIGDRGGRLAMLNSYQLFEQAPLVRHEELVAFVCHHRLHGRGVGWIDTHLLASALLGGFRLWTADPRLENMAREFRLAHEPGERGLAAGIAP